MTFVCPPARRPATPSFAVNDSKKLKPKRYAPISDWLMLLLATQFNPFSLDQMHGIVGRFVSFLSSADNQTSNSTNIFFVPTQ